MFWHKFAWAAVAVVSIAFLGDPRPGAARAQQADPVEQTTLAAVASATPAAVDLLEVPTLGAPADLVASTAAAPAAPEAVATATAANAEAAAAPEAAPEPAPVAQPAPRVAPVAPAAPAAPVAPVVAAPPPPPPSCPSGWFCYPRVGIAGPIVPYTDCSAATDVGTAIRSINCVSPTYLAGHAYTQFGLLTGWQAGDIVFAYGVRYTITGGFTQGSCAAPARALAPLSMQTSLSANDCGLVLVVQARPG